MAHAVQPSAPFVAIPGGGYAQTRAAGGNRVPIDPCPLNGPPLHHRLLIRIGHPGPVVHGRAHGQGLVLSSGPSGNVKYDERGNTTTLTDETLEYDAANRHVSTTTAGATVSYTRDATDRIVARTVTDTTASTLRYGFTAPVTVPAWCWTPRTGSSSASSPCPGESPCLCRSPEWQPGPTRTCTATSSLQPTPPAPAPARSSPTSSGVTTTRAADGRRCPRPVCLPWPAPLRRRRPRQMKIRFRFPSRTYRSHV